MTGPVVVIGDALIDEIRDESGVREFIGGAALNVAVGLTRLGAPATLIAMVGDDEAGDHIRSYLADYGVTLLASPAPHGSSRAVSTRGPGGEPVYEFNEAAQNRGIRFGDAERAALAEAAVVAVSCFPFDVPAEAEALAEAVAGSVVAVDPNPREGMMHDRAEFVRGFEALASVADLVKVGDDDAALLYRQGLDSVAEALRAKGATAVLATRGRDGATVMAGTETITQPISSMPGPIVDTMGAGDASFAVAVAALAEADAATVPDWREILAEAMDAAAATCRFEGALLRLPSVFDGEHADRIGT
ncbi:PfkB family carbohydrate kinase [Microbacterium sp. SSW1-59]|uniref:PfkB family carbohydrate kinase n=1 Tax=Microbacterium xanthum TaxID=3079794 RepID=UPI002AD5350E|nr:PfkB family carbohydrate kinase [Microbacterium sp. SSW1-59]MDZ8200118.1 PfkB family carbohydrate kinase [Microbacterium sp. SSW1-59]